MEQQYQQRGQHRQSAASMHSMHQHRTSGASMHNMQHRQSAASTCSMQQHRQSGASMHSKHQHHPSGASMHSMQQHRPSGASMHSMHQQQQVIEAPPQDVPINKRPKYGFSSCVESLLRRAWRKVQGSKPKTPSELSLNDEENSELEELEAPPSYRPESLEALCRATRFSGPELKRIYRGFKAECPSGVVREDTFKGIYSQFYPQGANTSQYAHYVFNTLDHDHSGLLSFEDFVLGLSTLSRGSLDEKLRWTFALYDINGDGCITREEMTDIVTAVYDLMGRFTDPFVDEAVIKEKVDRIFQKMDQNRDGVVTLDEFLCCCTQDEVISQSMGVFDSSI